MKNRNMNPKVSALGLAVQSALAVMFTMPMITQAAETALEDEVAEIRRPTSHIEVGAAGISDSSAKFGEYNGMNEHAAVIGNFGIRGGDAYLGGDGTTRWGVSGSNLGTTSRELGATVENQGAWSLRFGYDELRHNITDTYQTPQQGSMGGNTFTLPASFGIYSGATTATTTTVPPSTRAIPASALHTEEVSTTRKNTSLGAGLAFSKNLSLKFDYNHLDQTGAKLLGSATLGNVSTGGVGTWRAEALSILMNPTNYTTDNFNLGLNWVGDKGHLSGGYHASIFRDGYDRMSWQNPIVNAAGNTAPAGVYQTTTMSTAPDNQLHQVHLSGGYAFTSATKLVGGLSYGRNTQNESFLTGMPELVTTPTASLNGKVITKHADVKLVNQAMKDLSLSAALKYNERDNRTSSDTYLYRQLGNATYTGVNTPYSNRKTQLELAADYRLLRGNNLRIAYEREAIRRWCDDVADGYQCVASPSSKEDKLGLTYRMKASDSIKFNVGYAYANRDGEFDSGYVGNAGNRAHVTAPPTGATVPVLSATYGNAVLNGGNFLGYAAQPYASRKQNILSAGVNWQASNKLDVDLSGRHSKDDYESELGIQDGRTSSINLGATYAYNDDSSVSAYATWMNSKREMKIGATSTAAAGAGNLWPYAGVSATNFWTNQLNEDSSTVGLNSKHRLMGGKLELLGDLSYSLDKSHYATQVPYLPTCSAAGTLTCGDLPDIKSELLTLKIMGIYSIDKNAKLSVGYGYQNMKSDDYAYNWFQLGYTGTRGMPTNQVAPRYEIHLIAASYIYSFK